MSITPFLTTRFFDPEHIAAMGIAFEKACGTLGLAPKPDAVTARVAKAIIELADNGERDPERLYAGALARFGKTG